MPGQGRCQAVFLNAFSHFLLENRSAIRLEYITTKDTKRTEEKKVLLKFDACS